MDREEMRKAFEEWAKGFGLHFHHDAHDYEVAFIGWQAAMAHSCVLARNELHRDIMNLRPKAGYLAELDNVEMATYLIGHRDARHDAAELALATLSRHGG